MFERDSLAEQVDNFITLLRDDSTGQEAAQKSANGVLGAARGSSIQQLDEAVTRLATPLPDLMIGRAALLAVVCGALVEMGANAEAVAVPTLARFSEAVQLAPPFVEACIAESTVSQSTDGKESDQVSGEEAIERFHERVRERMPGPAQAYASLEWLSAAAVAMLSRSKALRRQFKSDRATAQAIARLAELGAELPCFHEMLSILDDEQLVVLHPEQGRGYVIRIAGIGNNFQLHTLLADALIGDVEQGWLPGERPSPEVAALAKDAPITNPRQLPTAFGSFNLWNWTGLGSDGSLPEGQYSGSQHWIWNEGIPADIVPFHGVRVILIGPAPYSRSWNSGRFFTSMVGELEVVRHLSTQEAHDWLGRIARAPKPAPAGSRITAADIESMDEE